MGCGILDNTKLWSLLGKHPSVQRDFPVAGKASGPGWQLLPRPCRGWKVLGAGLCLGIQVRFQRETGFWLLLESLLFPI